MSLIHTRYRPEHCEHCGGDIRQDAQGRICLQTGCGYRWTLERGWFHPVPKKERVAALVPTTPFRAIETPEKPVPPSMLPWDEPTPFHFPRGHARTITTTA